VLVVDYAGGTLHTCVNCEQAQRQASWKKYNLKFRALAGREVQVRGDGLCWLYALLTSMNLMENPMNPTRRDKVVLAMFVCQVKEFVVNRGLKRLTKGERARVSKLREDIPRELDEDSYGGGELYFRVIAAFLQTTIITVQDGYIEENINKNEGKRREPVCHDTITGGLVEYWSSGTAGR